MKSKEILVSVIIPVYNAEKYLSDCLDSARAQTLRDIEIICVDDGSTDRSADILKEYARKDSRFIILHQKNQYAGVARNHGMKCARGKYLAFWDADDIFAPSMLEIMYQTAEINFVDVVVCGYASKNVNSGNIVEFENQLYEYGLDCIPQTSCFFKTDIRQNLFQVVVGWPWDKLFRREHIQKNHIEFQALRTSNDGLFVYQALWSADRVAAVKDHLVIHRIENKFSLENTRTQSWNCAFEMLYAVEETMKIQKCYEIYKQSFLNHVLFFLLWNLETLAEWETYRLFFEKTKRECAQRFHLNDYVDSYFYDQNLYKRYLQLETYTPEEFLMEQKNEVRRKSYAYIEEIQQKQWIFPYKKIKKGTRLVLYGAGAVGKDFYLQAIRDRYCDVVLWVDKKRQNTEWYNKKISSVNSLEGAEYDKILIAISNRGTVQAVREMLTSLHISSNKIIDIFQGG